MTEQKDDDVEKEIIKLKIETFLPWLEEKFGKKFQLNLEGLREHIEANMADWLATGRTLEVNQNASIVADQRRDINAYEQALSEIEAALGVSG